MFILHFLKSWCRSVTNLVTRSKKNNFHCFSYSRKSMNCKPPNILVFTGNDSSQLFKNIEDNILKCLQVNSYLIYHLLLSEVVKQPWTENTLLLVISSDEIDECTAAVFENFIKTSGKILLICSKFNNLAGIRCIPQTINTTNLVQVKSKNIGEASVYRGKYSYHSSEGLVLFHDSQDKPVVHKSCNNGILVASEIYLDRDPESSGVSPKYDKEMQLLVLKRILSDEFGLKIKLEESCVHGLTPGYFMSDKFEKNILDLNDCSDNSVFCELELKEFEPITKLLIYYHNKSNAKSINFAKSLYFSCLKTDMYGHHLVYFPVISSTMDVAKQLSDYDGIVIVASCQLSGKGRGGNKWISPVGCAMFTLYFTLPLFSNLGQRISLIQHIAALALVHGIRVQQRYKDLNLKIKWPNDIYFDGCKIGGLIVSSTILGKVASISIGWGVNIANYRPTVCINDAIEKYNLENSCNLPHLQIEQVIASTISQMEYFMKNFETLGDGKFYHYYYSYWLHSNHKVTLKSFNEQGTITGLDEYGFLIVKTDKGKEISLQPDGNRFDLMKNLIYSRE